MRKFLYGLDLDIFAVDGIEWDRVEDESVEDFAKDLPVADPLIEILLWNFLKKIGDPLKSFVLELDVSL
jgi:hypothetical protein